MMPNEILDSKKTDLHEDSTKVHVKYSNLEYSNEIQRNLEEKYSEKLKGYAMKESVAELKNIAIGKIESVSMLIEKI